MRWGTIHGAYVAEPSSLVFRAVPFPDRVGENANQAGFLHLMAKGSFSLVQGDHFSQAWFFWSSVTKVVWPGNWSAAVPWPDSLQRPTTCCCWSCIPGSTPACRRVEGRLRISSLPGALDNVWHQQSSRVRFPFMVGKTVLPGRYSKGVVGRTWAQPDPPAYGGESSVLGQWSLSNSVVLYHRNSRAVFLPS